MSVTAQQSFKRRQQRTRFRLKQRNNGRLRLSVYRSNKNIYAQLIDDADGKTIVAASSLDKEVGKDAAKGVTVDHASKVGKLLADRAKKAKATTAFFDRGGYRYHGRVKALAEGARENGLVL